jgi:acyl-CoA thioesterase-1
MIMAVSIRLMPGAAAVALIGGCVIGGCAIGCGGARDSSSNLPAPAATAVGGVSAPSVPPSVVKEDTRPVIVAFGDSLSAGFGLDPGQSYPDDLQRLVDAAGYRYRVVNLGVSGDTTTDGVERLPSVLAMHPAIVVLEFGGNDGLRGQPVASAKQNMAGMIEALRKNGAQVIIAGMTLPRNYGPEYIHSFEQMYVELANEYHLVRIPFLLDGVGGVASLTQPDGLHPTAKGAQIVAGTVMKYLKPLLKPQG